MTTPRYWDPTTSQWLPFAGPQGAQGAQGPAGLGTGPAGGDLSGNYPNPTVAGIGGAPYNAGYQAGGAGSFLYQLTSGGNQWVRTPAAGFVNAYPIWNGTNWTMTTKANPTIGGSGTAVTIGPQGWNCLTSDEILLTAGVWLVAAIIGLTIPANTSGQAEPILTTSTTAWAWPSGTGNVLQTSTTSFNSSFGTSASLFVMGTISVTATTPIYPAVQVGFNSGSTITTQGGYFVFQHNLMGVQVAP